VPVAPSPNFSEIDTADVRNALAAYRGPRNGASITQLILTMALFVAGWVAMWFSLSWSYWFTLMLAVPTAGMAVRLFILQHDCGHGSFFSSARANRIVGTTLSAFTLTPYDCWKRQHAIHHANNGHLDHRGIGDVDTWTVDEYRAASPWRRLGYRLYRNPLILFGIGPIVHFGVLQRFTWTLPGDWTIERRSVHLTNFLVVVGIAVCVWLVGPLAFLKIHLPVMVIASSLGAWLFYIQHQFDPAHWRRDEDWDYYTAAIEGSSYLDIPWVLHWVTGYIGYHHVHHLDSRIPNYALARSADAHPSLNRATRITLWSSVRHLNLKLWDERERQLISFGEARRRYR